MNRTAPNINKSSPSDVIGYMRAMATERMYETSRTVQERQAWSAWEHELGKLNTSGMPNPFDAPSFDELNA